MAPSHNGQTKEQRIQSYLLSIPVITYIITSPGFPQSRSPVTADKHRADFLLWDNYLISVCFIVAIARVKTER